MQILIIIYQLLQFILKNSTGEYNDKISFNSLLLTKVTNAEKFYANIVRSFLSKEVTQLIAINCIDSTKIPYNMGEGQSGYPQYQDYKKFRALIERYSLLEHITNINEFPDITDYYDKSAFGNNINVEK